jgi:hypothetical protein
MEEEAMSDLSDNSAQLADQLRETALKNLGRSNKQYRSAISGKFVTPSTATKHARTTATEASGGSGKSISRSSVSGRFLGKKGKG